MLEKIKEALGEELAEQVEAKLTEAKLEIGVTNDGSLVPAKKHDDMKAELEEANSQVESMTTQINDLSKNTGDADELKAEIVKLKDEIETNKNDSDKRIANIQKKSALQTALIKEGADAKNVDLLNGQFNLDDLELTENGEIKDADKIIAPVKEKRAALFVKTTTEGLPPKKEKGRGADKSLVYSAEKAYKDNPSLDNMAALSRAKLDAESKKEN